MVHHAFIVCIETCFVLAHLAETGEAEIDALALGEGVTLVRADSGLAVPLADGVDGDRDDGVDG